MARVSWASLSNPSPYRDAAYSTCVLRDVVYVAGFDEVLGFGRQRYRIEARSVRSGVVVGRWVDEKGYSFASLYSCAALKDRVFAVGATEVFWSVIAFDKGLNIVLRRDFEKPRFIPYSIAVSGDMLFVAGAELLPGGGYAMHVEAVSIDDLTPLARYSSNPRQMGAAAYATLYNTFTGQLVVGGFDNAEGYRSWRIEVLSKDLSLQIISKPQLRGAITALAMNPGGYIYAVGRNGVAKVNRDGGVASMNTGIGGCKALASPTESPLESRIAIISDDTLHIVDENLKIVESLRIARGTEILTAMHGGISFDKENMFIALTQITTDIDWNWSIIAVNPRPRRFKFF